MGGENGPQITVTNVDDGDVLTYSLASLRGTTSANCSTIHISTATASSTHVYPVLSSRFTALCELKPGRNTIRLSSTAEALHTSSAHTLTLFYTPPSPARPFVRLVYLLAADSDGSFQSDEPRSQCDINAGKARLQTAGLVIQSACAEMMHTHGFQRRTFALSPTVLVHRLSNLSLSQAHGMSGMDLWKHIADNLSRLPQRDNSIDVAVMSFTRLVNGKPRAHTALGGGTLALFGGASMFSWPANTAKIAERLSDCRKFDPHQLFDDSAGRAQRRGRRACASTTIGALLHELGHCLSLPHPTGDAQKDGGGIMARGFDFLDRLFVQADEGAALPFWDRGSAIRLRYHRFLQFEGEGEFRRERSVSAGSRFEATPAPHPLPTPVTGPKFLKLTNGNVVCRSPVGIGHIAYYKNSENASHEELFDEEPTEFQVPSILEIRRRCRASASDNIKLSAIDLDGRITDTPYDDL